MLIYSAIGIVIAVLAGLARSSVRRLIVAASLGLLITFFGMPFSEAVGHLSRQTIKPTLLGLVPLFPLLLMIAAAAMLTFGMSFIGKRWLALTAFVSSLASLAVVILWQSETSAIVAQLPLFGLMEALTGVILAGVIILISWGNKRLRWIMAAVAVAMGVAAFFWLNSDTGHSVFPNSEGYYKLLTPTELNSSPKLSKTITQA